MFSHQKLGGNTQQVYDYLYEEIVNNRLTPGSQIAELDISQTLNVSRSPVREALYALEGVGLVRRFPNRGCIVSPVTPHDVDEIFGLRILHEVYALRESFKHLNKNSLNDLLRDLESLTIESAPEAYFETDRQLHGVVVGNCGNTRLIQILHTINGQIEQFRRISSMQPKRLTQSRLEHIAIVQAMIDNDLEKSCGLLEDHIKNVKSSTLSTLLSLGM